MESGVSQHHLVPVGAGLGLRELQAQQVREAPRACCSLDRIASVIVAGMGILSHYDHYDLEYKAWARIEAGLQRSLACYVLMRCGRTGQCRQTVFGMQFLH